MKEKSHIGCLILFIVTALLFVAYSVPKLKQQDQQKQERKLTDAERKRVWEIVDSVKHEELMEDYDYAELYEENKELKDRIKRIKELSEELNDKLSSHEIDLSELNNIVDEITFECE